MASDARDAKTPLAPDPQATLCREPSTNVVVPAPATRIDRVEVAGPPAFGSRGRPFRASPVHLRIVEQFNAGAAAQATEPPDEEIMLYGFKFVRFSAMATKR
jgi:hypothetical protein